MTTDRWRIDDLAHETGLTVDTIRYYQREGLLPPGTREGRHRIYGPEHVERLRRIKDLQARRFSIAAIRALVSEGSRLDSVFADPGESLELSYEELRARSGASEELASELREAGILRDPQDFGRTAYDGADLAMLTGVAELERAGVPLKVLRELGTIYARGIEAMQRQVVDLFLTGGGLEWEDGELDRLRDMLARDSQSMLPAMHQLVDYTHHRTIQRLALDAVGREIEVHAVDDTTDELPLPVEPRTDA